MAIPAWLNAVPPPSPYQPPSESVPRSREAPFKVPYDPEGFDPMDFDDDTRGAGHAVLAILIAAILASVILFAMGR